MDTAKIILRDDTLRWSSPQLFNDPFDVPRKLEFEFSLEELQQAAQEEFLRVLEADRFRFHYSLDRKKITPVCAHSAAES